MAPKANLLTTDEVAGVMKTAMEKPSGRPVVEPKWWTRLMAVVDDVSKRNDELRAELKQAQAAAAAASTSAAAAATGAGDAASRLEKENAELKKKLEERESTCRTLYQENTMMKNKAMLEACSEEDEERDERAGQEEHSAQE